MTNPDDPVKYQESPFVDEAAMGLTKREYFAAMALQGFLSGNSMRELFGCTDGKQTVLEWLMEQSLTTADVLIAALNEKKE